MSILKKIIRFLTYFIFLSGIIIFPFVFWTKAEIAYEIPRVWFIQRWTEILGILAILNLFLIKKEKIDGKLLLLIGSFLVIALISSILGADFYKSLWGNYYREDGLFTLIHLAGFFFFIVLFFDRFLKRITPVILSVSSLILSLWTIIVGFQINLFHNQSINYWDGAIGISFGNPNFLGGYLLVCLPFLALLVTESKTRGAKIFWIFGLGVQILAIILTKSLGSILGVFLFILGWFILLKKLNRKKIIILILTLAVAVSFCLIQRGIKRFPDEFTAEGRERIIRKGLLGFNKKPLLGWGWANFDYAFESVDWPFKLQHDVYVDKAHSVILEILVTAGIAGLIIYLAIIFRVIGNLLKTEGSFSLFCLLSLILYIFHSQTNVISIGEEVIFWLIVGIATKDFANKYS